MFTCVRNIASFFNCGKLSYPDGLNVKRDFCFDFAQSDMGPFLYVRAHDNIIVVIAPGVGIRRHG